MSVKISKKVRRDAWSVATGLYRMNATLAVGYAFTCGKGEVDRGEFIFSSELREGRVCPERFDGYIDFKTKTLQNLHSGTEWTLEDDKQ